MEDVQEALSRALTSDSEPSDDATGIDVEPVVRDGITWLIRGAQRDPGTGMWLSPALEAAHVQQAAPVVEWRVYRSANRGVAGVLYVLAKLWRHRLTRAKAIPELTGRSVDWLLAHHDCPDEQMPGLHFGEAGVAVAIAECLAASLIEPGVWTDHYFREVFSSGPDWPDLTHGAAGQGLAALHCRELVGAPWIGEASDSYADYLVSSQNADGSWSLPPGVAGMEDKNYTGCAHGAAGIVHFLSMHAGLRGSARSLEAAELGAEWLLDQAKPGGAGSGLSWPLFPETSESWNWWCHGAPGIAQAYLSLFRATGNELHASTARACLRAVPAEVRSSNLSQCHGMAGLGELLMEGFEVLGDPEFRDASLRIAGVLTDLSIPADAGITWKVESPYTNETDLMGGCAGIVHFLARIRAGAGFGMPLQPSTIRISSEKETCPA
jgi:lantibiotic modifying enzyme